MSNNAALDDVLRVLGCRSHSGLRAESRSDRRNPQLGQFPVDHGEASYGFAAIAAEYVAMDAQHTRQGDREMPQLWSIHRNTLDVNRVNAVQQMWEQLEPYVREAAELVE